MKTRRVNGCPQASWWADCADFYGQQREEQPEMEASPFGKTKVLSSAAFTVDYLVGTKAPARERERAALGAE